MNNKNILTERNSNINFKDLFIKKLKDRNKIKGHCFSYSFNAPIFNHSFIQKILYKTYYDVSKKIYKENKYKFAIDDYNDLKKNIISFEKKYNNGEKKIIPKEKNFSYEKINYTNLNEIFREFLRDKKKHSFNKNNIIKSKIKLNIINRNTTKYRINALLSKISLKSVKIKTKIDTGRNKRENNEKSFNILIGKINDSRKKLEKKYNNYKRKSMFLNLNRIESIDKNKNQKYIIKSISNHKILDKNDYNEKNKQNIKEKYNNLYDGIDYKEKENKKIDINKIDKKNDILLNIKVKQRPKSNSRNIIKFSQLYNNTTSDNTYSNQTRIVKSAIKKEAFKIIDKPLYTTKIEDIMNEYYRIKKKSKLIKKKYRENHLANYKEIDNIIKIKEDLLIFQLKQKFLRKQFPKSETKKINKKELFIKKFRNDFDFFDNKYLNYHIST